MTIFCLDYDPANAVLRGCWGPFAVGCQPTSFYPSDGEAAKRSLRVVMSKVPHRSWRDFAESLAQRTPYSIWWVTVDLPNSLDPEAVFDLALLVESGMPEAWI